MPAVDSGAVGNQDIIAGATKDPTYEGASIYIYIYIYIYHRFYLQ